MYAQPGGGLWAVSPQRPDYALACCSDVVLDDAAFEPVPPSELSPADSETKAEAVLTQQAAEPEDAVESVLTEMTSATEASYAEEQVTRNGMS